MSFRNPTQLQIGMAGDLAGRRYRVAGRVVMGMEEGGETYYWNEFNLVDDEGNSATLVFEETERGGEWRLFTMFEPEYPMTAEDAATKHVGDPLNLEGTPVRVTLVDESRVYHLEGEAPEGVEVGDVARYFNAEAGNTMIVVSWTGDEVEYYRGVDLSRGTVASAFSLRGDGFSRLLKSAGAPSAWSDAEDDDRRSQLTLRVVGAVLAAAIAFASYSSCAPRRPSIAKKVGAPPSPLTIGSIGALDGRTYRIQGHAVAEIAEVGLLCDRHEYQLVDDDGNGALLVCGLKPGAKDWFLFTPLQPLNPLTPSQAAALRAGDTVNIDGYVAPVSELFQSEIRQLAPEPSPPIDVKTGDVFYGFSGKSGSTLLFARWNDSGITFHKGKALPAKEVTAAFNRPAGP